MDPRYYVIAKLWELERYNRSEPVRARRPRKTIRPRIGGMLVRLGSRMAERPLVLQGGHR